MMFNPGRCSVLLISIISVGFVGLSICQQDYRNKTPDFHETLHFETDLNYGKIIHKLFFTFADGIGLQVGPSSVV